MEIEKVLRQFKNIRPRDEFSKISRATILATPRIPQRTWAEILWPSLRFSSAALITGFIIFVVVGVFSLTGINSKVPVASLDPITLRAEAEAIDIQIQLTALGYDNPLQVIHDTSTPTGLSLKKPAKTEVSNEQKKISEAEKTEVVEEISIEEALEKLAL